jgi:AraC-like DNA-binding protein
MPFHHHIPSPPLDAFIDDLHYIDGPAPTAPLKVLPYPASQLIINLGGAFRVYASHKPQPIAICTDSWTVGLWSRYHIVEWSPHVSLYGIHFKPFGISPFVRMPLSELHNQIVPLDAIWGSYAAEIRERLADALTIQHGFHLLERLLLARLAQPQNALDLVQHAVTEIERHQGMLKISVLSDDLGISTNHLGTHFERLVGVTPKELSRFYRFASVIRAVNPAEPVDWTRLAHQSGFYDQSHFNKDFVAFSGLTPTDYLRLRRMQLKNPASGPIPGPLPID